jgi:Tetratricopeptide repeat
VRDLVVKARRHLDREDPLLALDAFAAIAALAPADRSGMMGLARTWLLLGKPGLAVRYIEAVRREDPRREDAIALHVRILIRAAQFDRAVKMSTRAIERIQKPSVGLLASHASALFRVQRTVDAAGVYQRVLLTDPLHAEAHLRLGSGLLPPREAPYVISITRGIRSLRIGAFDQAIRQFSSALKSHPGHPVAHRLLGETLFNRRHLDSMVATAKCYHDLRAALPVPSIAKLPWKKFLPTYGELGLRRRRVVARSLSLFGHLLPKLVIMRGRHDILREDERTTDSIVRSRHRGKRTFDGRVWDDVRGMGGLRAATGIEALDDAANFDFDTLSHEVAHQAHLFAFTRIQRARVKALYRKAKAAGRCLDYYAASNDAEYFGQGVEAFVSMGKRPGSEKTHGHTRFELRRVDPELHDFIASVVSFDPLGTVERRRKILPAAVAVALRSGRPDDAMVAAGMMDPGAERQRLVALARRAQLLSRTY